MANIEFPDEFEDIGRALTDDDQILVNKTKSSLSRVKDYVGGGGGGGGTGVAGIFYFAPGYTGTDPTVITSFAALQTSCAGISGPKIVVCSSNYAPVVGTISIPAANYSFSQVTFYTVQPNPGVIFSFATGSQFNFDNVIFDGVSVRCNNTAAPLFSNTRALSSTQQSATFKGNASAVATGTVPLWEVLSAGVSAYLHITDSTLVGTAFGLVSINNSTMQVVAQGASSISSTTFASSNAGSSLTVQYGSSATYAAQSLYTSGTLNVSLISLASSTSFNGYSGNGLPGVSNVQTAVDTLASPIITSVSADYTFNANDGFILVSTASGNVNITVPATTNVKRPTVIAKVSTDANTITVNAVGGGTVQGVSSYLLPGSSGSTLPNYTLVPVGVNTWDVLPSYSLVNSVSGTGAISSTGGTTPVISVAQDSAQGTTSTRKISSATPVTIGGAATGGTSLLASAADHVHPITETSGPTVLTIGAISNNQYLQRSGTAIIGVTPPTPVTSVTGTAPISSSGGTTPVISITAATTSAAGTMSASDKTKLDGSPIWTGTAPSDTQIPYWDAASSTVKWENIAGAPVRYYGAAGKIVTQIGSETVIGALGAFDPTGYASPSITFDALYNFTPGSAGSVEIRLYDMGTRLSPTSGTLRSTISTTYLNAGIQQCISRTLSVSSSPGTNTDQIQNAERVYELRAIIIGAVAGDALNIEVSGLTVVATSAVAGGIGTITWSNVSAAIATANSSLNVNTQKVVNVVDPVAAQDAATKNYVDTTRWVGLVQHIVSGSEGTSGSPVSISAYTTMVECESATADTYLILPTLVNAPIGTVVQVSKANTSTFKINVAPDSGSSINGGTTNASADIPNSTLASSTGTGSSAAQDVIAQFRRTGTSTWRMA